MLYVTDFLQSAAATPRASSASGSKNHRATLYCRQADSAAAAFCVSAWLALVYQRGYLLCSGVICNPLEHGSVIALDCKSCERGTGGILDERKTRIAATDRLTVNYRNHDGVRCGARTHDT